MPDECKGVGVEIGTTPKRKTTSCYTRNEHMVSSYSDIRYKCVEQQMEQMLILRNFTKKI